MKEEQIQKAIAQTLDIANVQWCHVPNGGHRHIAVATKMKAAGAKPGVPDVMIFDEPPTAKSAKGAALELKTRKGRLTDHQAEWCKALVERGWAVAVTKGLDEAMMQLRDWGYIR